MSLNLTNQTIGDGLSRIRIALGAAAGGWGSRIVFVGVGVIFSLLYLVGIGELWITATPGEFTVRVAANPLRAFAITGLGRFGAVSIVFLGGLGLTYLFSPLDLITALLIGGLVGANAALTYRGIRQRRLSVSTFVLAGIPPLLMAAAAIGPIAVSLASVPNSSLIIIGVRLLVPVSAVLLVGSILHLNRQVTNHRDEPTSLEK